MGELGKRLASTFDVAAAVDDARRTCVDELRNLLSTTGRILERRLLYLARGRDIPECVAGSDEAKE